MTNFQLITQNATTLDDFISAVVDDALAAEGCSMELKLPYELQEGAGGVFLQWKEWLEQENEDECICLAQIVRSGAVMGLQNINDKAHLVFPDNQEIGIHWFLLCVLLISNRRTSMITRFWGIKHKLIEENRAKKNGGMWRPVKNAPTQADEGHLQFPLKTFVE